MSITTPPVAIPIDELSPTQKELVKTELDIGKVIELLFSVKTASDHAINVDTLADGFIYLVQNDDIIESGDTVSDVALNSFDVQLVGCDYIPANWYASVRINGTIAEVSRYVAFNDIGGDFLSKFGSTGTLDGEFDQPYDIFCTETNLYVVDFSNDRVQIFDLNGNYISQFGSTGSANGQFSNPRGICVNETNIFVTDSGNDRVQIFDLNGTYVGQFGSTGTGNGQFSNPNGLSNSETNLYVVDLNNDRVQIFDLNGNYISQFGSTGSANGLFNEPRMLFFFNNVLFISDSSNDNIQKFI